VNQCVDGCVSYTQEREMRSKLEIEENIRDKMLVDEIVRKTIEEDDKFVTSLIMVFVSTDGYK